MCQHQRITLHERWNPNPYEIVQRGECMDCGKSLDATDFPEGAEVRDEYGRNPTPDELHNLIETLESDLANRPTPPEFEGDFAREMMEQTLEQARARLDEMTNTDL